MPSPKLIESRPSTPAFPLRSYRIGKMWEAQMAFDWRALRHHEAYKTRKRRRQKDAIRSNRAADARGSYMLDADGTVF